ncbi:MAG: gliding motility-associated C-terminal domain-containing protein, partial [Flavipsychrobacter sp.]|nr:gliding motility-associated C-terminal domain-containing protein [Flavipsychrobacter sp.]
TAKESTKLDAQACCVVSLPNVFTPNGDGKNDIFRPITTGTHAIKRFIIVNRWGTKVFETVDEGTGWDGTYNGVDQNIDTYYYILQYKCNGKTEELKGDVTLIR